MSNKTGTFLLENGEGDEKQAYFPGERISLLWCHIETASVSQELGITCNGS